MENIKFEVDPKKIQAFPDEYNEGMTLRDYFAAKAMQGMLTNGSDVHPKLMADKATRAYEYADFMLVARSK